MSCLEFKPLGALEGTVVLSVEQGGKNGTFVLVQITRYLDLHFLSLKKQDYFQGYFV